MSNFLQIRPVGAELYMRRDMTHLIFVFRNCANAPKNDDNAMLGHSLFKVTTRMHHKDQSQLILHHAMKEHRTADVQFHSFWSSDLDEDEWSDAGTGRCTHAKGPRHPLNSRLGGPQYWSERFALPGLESRTVQPVA